MANLVWLQGATDNGCTISFLNTQQPDVVQVLTKLGARIAFHPTINPASGPGALRALEPFTRGAEPLDVLILEGAVQRGPQGSGEYCLIGDRPFKDLLAELAGVASYMVAVGTCATYGGVASAAPNPTEATGLQFHKKEKGGFLGAGYRSRAGLPVINLPGCPAHSDHIIHTLVAVLLGKTAALSLDEYQRPLNFYEALSHHSCPNNEYFEYKKSAENFTDKGCLFENLGCRGTTTHSDCNIRLWNRQSSKTRAGSPCMGCTEPEFPDDEFPLYQTPKRAGIPLRVPLGVPKGRYRAMAVAAKLACPARLKD